MCNKAFRIKQGLSTTIRIYMNKIPQVDGMNLLQLDSTFGESENNDQNNSRVMISA